MESISKQSVLERQVRRKRTVMADLEREPFRAPLWGRNCHVQTVGARYVRRVTLPPMRLERWDTPDGDFLRVHFCDGDPDKPVVLLLHGLEGSVNSTYMVGMLRALEAQGYPAVVMEHRSCGGEINRALRLYHSGETTDLAFVVDRLIERRPDTRILLIGYSLGGNQIAKWLGEKGDGVPSNVIAAAVVSAPFDLTASQDHIDRGVRRGYAYHFLRKLIPKAVEKERQYPGCVDIEAVKRCSTFRAFDDHATAPIHGFEDAADYYRKVACGQFLHGIRRPTLFVSAADDPFNPGATFPHDVIRESPFLHPLFTARGGHVGFIHAAESGGLAYWAEDQIGRFFSAYANEG